jgi:demethylmenaquinone methyltransferase/2-methoxy-6-polyprenyl-1,4-benzoquinol methylase|tara:strand:+ start:408 stop:1130 length:723 start_codon:yes stop_codon:yes gene_type:complete
VNHKPYNNLNNSKKEQMITMFDRIASTYDRLNRLITFGMDKIWRKRVAKMIAAKHPTTILDVATGTGALAIDLATLSPAQVTGIDISEEMLAIGQEKIKSLGLDNMITMQLDDAEALSFESNIFDAATIGFGVRNFENLDQGLCEVNRVLKPGCQLVVLETSVPKYFPFKQGYYLYTTWIVPMLGKLFAKNKVAYEYLSSSASIFPDGDRFNQILKKNGFKNITSYPKMLGIVTIYSAFK